MSTPQLPPEEVVRMILSPQTPAEENVVAYLLTTMRRQLPTLSAMLSREFKAAVRDAGLTGRRECLLAVVEIFAEVHGMDAVHEAISASSAPGRTKGGRQR